MAQSKHSERRQGRRDLVWEIVLELCALCNKIPEAFQQQKHNCEYMDMFPGLPDAVHGARLSYLNVQMAQTKCPQEMRGSAPWLRPLSFRDLGWQLEA